MKKQKGFTLTETILALAALGFAMGFVSFIVILVKLAIQI